MKVLIVDDEISAIEVLEKRLREVLGEGVTIFTARNGKDALEIVRDKHVEVMFLDVEMPGTNGLEIARQSKELYPKTNVILCTAYEKYALQAWDLFISGYIVKPATPEDIRKALDHLRTPVENRLVVRCFGNFEVFCRNEIVEFKRSGAKELLAYLIDRRGSSVNSGELCAMLRNDAEDPELKKANLRKYVMELKKTLSAIGHEGIFRHTRDNYSIYPAKLDCDFYRFLEGDADARKMFNGEYMVQYSWAERTIGLLEASRVEKWNL